MKSFIKIIAVVILVVALPAVTLCQKITYSDFEQEDNRDINFEIIGKMNGNVLVYKNMRWRHKINIFGDDMKIKETVKLDFIPEKTFNVDFVTYPDYFFMIYQYQKRNTLHCMAVKMDGNGKKLADPVEIDTTQIPSFSDNKIYSTVYSEDKQKVMVFKIPKRNDKYTLVTMLFNNDMKLLTNKTRVPLELDDRKDNYSNFSVDNDGNFVFTRETRAGVRDNSLYLQMAVKNMAGDTVQYRKIDLEKNYIDDVSLKIDNLNKRYILNAFYYKKNRGSIDGLFTNVWERTGDSSLVKTFTQLDDNLRNEAKTNGSLRFALDDYFIRQTFVKKDGGFLLTAEDHSTQSRNTPNMWNRWDYLNNFYFNPYSYYYYDPYGFYRPFNSFGQQSTRYSYGNIVVLSFDKKGALQWSRVIMKDQFDYDDDNFLSYSTMNSGAGIHFLFNDDRNRNQLVANHSISGNGTVTRNPTLKTQERGYQFMSRLSKQTGNNQLIIPCIYRNTYVCFAKVDM